MTQLLIAMAVILVIATVASGLWFRRTRRDPLDRKSARKRVSGVLAQAVASVPANAFDARLRIVRPQV